MSEEPTLTCPECGSENITVSHEQMFMANTGEHYCHRIKTHDGNSRSTCLDCDWEGLRQDLVEQGGKE